jgi:hypothetical protein
MAPDADMIIALTEAKDQAILNLNVATGEIELARKEIVPRSPRPTSRPSKCGRSVRVVWTMRSA